MDYPIKTLNQLRPILQGFRKTAGLTQAMMASQLGVTQQTYAQLEANPAAVSVERLFRVLRLLDAELTLVHTTALVPAAAGEDSEQATSTRAQRSPKRTVTARTRAAGHELNETRRSAHKLTGAPRKKASKTREDW